MSADAIERLDSFPYRFRVGDVMSIPPVTVDADASLADAANEMQTQGVSSILTTDDTGRPYGILTEHDLLRAIIADPPTIASRTVGPYLVRPVVSVPADAYVHVAIGRMHRLALRHLAVVDPRDGALVGVVTSGNLLRQRARRALALGDEVEAANGAEDLAGVMRQLPKLVQGLMNEHVPTLEIAGVISSVIRTISARSAALASAAMAEEGWGPAPAPWCLLVLGSAGRGESLLAADQDNALVWGPTAAGDGWFAELGRRTTVLLDAAGIPFCRGKVMASEPSCRGSLPAWELRVDHWARQPQAESRLNIDIFYDFQPVFGDRSLSETLRAHALAAAKSQGLMVLLAGDLEGVRPPIDLLGRLRSRNGRIELKDGGIRPLVGIARILALLRGAATTATLDRLGAAERSEAFTDRDAILLQEAYEMLLGLVLGQQLSDLAAGNPAGTKVELARLTRLERERLRSALGQIGQVGLMLRNILGMR